MSTRRCSHPGPLASLTHIRAIFFCTGPMRLASVTCAPREARLPLACTPHVQRTPTDRTPTAVFGGHASMPHRLPHVCIRASPCRRSGQTQRDPALQEKCQDLVILLDVLVAHGNSLKPATLDLSFGADRPLTATDGSTTCNDHRHGVTRCDSVAKPTVVDGTGADDCPSLPPLLTALRLNVAPQSRSCVPHACHHQQSQPVIVACHCAAPPFQETPSRC